MKNVDRTFSELRALLADLTDPADRLEFFVEQARSCPSLPEEYKNDSFKVRGCISNLWIVPSYIEGRCHFLCDGDAVIPKGVAWTLLELFQNCAPEDILAFESDRLRELGIAEVLSLNRRNALTHVFQSVYQFALSVLNSAQPTVVNG